MDAPLAAPLELARWRRATVVAVAVAAAEALLIVVVGAIVFGPRLLHHVRDAAVEHALAGPKQTLAPPPRAHAQLPRAQTSVMVLNGNGRTGAAQVAADQVKRHGYTIGSVGNAPSSDYAKTLIMYRRGFRGEAIRLRKDLRRGRVAPLDGLQPRDLMGAHLVLVLGASF
jgi:hypothetical protein